MADVGRKGNAKMRYRAEAELISKYGELSSRQLAEKLYEEYGIEVSHAQVNNDLKHDVAAFSDEELEDKKSGLLVELEELIDAARNISKTDPNNNTRLKAMETYNRLIKTQADILCQFEKVKLKAKEQQRPIYKVKVEKPTIATKENVKGQKNDGAK